MKAEPKELIELWTLELEGQATSHQSARLEELLQDENLAEAFGKWQARRSSKEAASLVPDPSWEPFKRRASRSLKLLLTPWWLQAWFVTGAAAAVLTGTVVLVHKVPRLNRLLSLSAATPTPFILPTATPAPLRLGAPPEQLPAAAAGTVEGSGGTGRQVSLVVEQGAPAEVSVRVLSLSGQRMKTLYHGWLDGGRQAFTWDGNDEGGKPVPPGQYKVEVRSGSQVRFSYLSVSSTSTGASIP